MRKHSQNNKTSLVLTLARRISISVALFSFLLFGIACLLEYFHSEKVQEKNAHNLAVYLAGSLSNSVFVFDNNSIDAATDAVMQNKNIVGIKVFDQWDNPMHSSGKETLKKPKKFELNINRDDIHIGRLEVLYLVDKYGLIHSNFIIGLILACLLSAGLSAFVISISLKRFLTAPINKLSNMAIAFGNGDFKERKDTKYVEFQVLENVLWEMNQQIQNQIGDLSKTNDNLQSEVKQKELVESLLRTELDLNKRIAEISKGVLAEHYDIKRVSDRILSAARSLTKSEHGFVSSIDKNTLENVGHALTEMFDKSFELKGQKMTFPIGDDGTYGGLWGHTLNTMDSFFSNTPDNHPSSKGVPEGHVSIENYMAVPVLIGDNLLGLIALANSDRDYSEKDVDSVKRISELYALAIHRYNYETEKAKMKERILQSQKMESIGNLAGGIAHDFNNILTPIIGYAEMIAEDFSNGSIEQNNAFEILTAGKRAKELVTQILSFSREHEHKLVPVQMQTILKEVVNLSRSIIPSNIQLHLETQTDCGPVMADATQIHQVVMNLITNAYHAVMQIDGEITVVLKKIKLKGSDYPGILLKKGNYAMLTVSDNGVGIPKDIQNKIFEPYFTTKKTSKGTGLGLAVVYGIIKEHQGDIHVYSEPGKGTVFKIILPLITKSVETVSEPESSELETGDERILLVDDEVAVATLGKRILERLGYTVTDKCDSIEALDTFKTNPDDFDLVLSDMTMPNMTGDQLTKELLSIRPDIPIIICTGFSDRINEEQSKTIGVKGYLMKPALQSQMAQIVRKVLDENKRIL